MRRDQVAAHLGDRSRDEQCHLPEKQRIDRLGEAAYRFLLAGTRTTRTAVAAMATYRLAPRAASPAGSSSKKVGKPLPPGGVRSRRPATKTAMTIHPVAMAIVHEVTPTQCLSHAVVIPVKSAESGPSLARVQRRTAQTMETGNRVMTVP